MAYFVKGKGHRYDFTMKGERYTEAWFKTKREAQQAEARKREELKNPKPEAEETPTDITFLDLVNLRLDYVKAYNVKGHYENYLYMARKWIGKWGNRRCDGVTEEEIYRFLLGRRRTSPATANREIRYLRATFNFGRKMKLLLHNPLDGIEFFPVDRIM